MALSFRNKKEAMVWRNRLIAIRNDLKPNHRNYRKDYNALTQEINEVSKWIKDN